MAWQRLGEVAPSQLRDARAQAHWAAQLIAAAGETFLPHLPDTSHTAMRWEAGAAALVGRAIPAPTPCRVALRISDLCLLLLGGDAAPVAELALPGRTLAEAQRWTAEAVRRHSAGALDRALVAPDYELPPHGLGKGGRFELDPGLPELARWYADADEALRELAGKRPDAGEVLCWPHHFDLASLIALERGPDGGELRSVGVGLSPGDEQIEQPYWYVNHEPEAPDAPLPRLAAGEWLTEGWIGAVLRGDDLVAAGDAGAQAARLRAYLDSAVPASVALARAAPLPGPG